MVDDLIRRQKVNRHFGHHSSLSGMHPRPLRKVALATLYGGGGAIFICVD